MPGVQRSLRQKVFAGAAVLALLAGGALAAVSATGQKNTHKDRNKVRQARLADRAGGAGRIGHVHDLASAAAYLGVSSARLEGELRAGKTLAQVADATSGKSAAGLIEALVAAKRSRLTAAAAKLPQRVSAEVNRVGLRARAATPINGAARLQSLFAGRHHVGAVAAGYLGMTAAQLRAELRAGKTLALVADATAGRSTAGLIDALVAAKRERLTRAVSAKRITTAEQAKLLAAFGKRASALVQRQFAGAGKR
jgi:ABC-type microcin C transport system duplicated ATPase subunit YejF